MPVHIDLLYRVGIKRADTYEDATRVRLCVPGFCDVSHMTAQMYPRQAAMRSIYSVCTVSKYIRICNVWVNPTASCINFWEWGIRRDVVNCMPYTVGYDFWQWMRTGLEFLHTALYSWINGRKDGVNRRGGWKPKQARVIPLCMLVRVLITQCCIVLRWQ